MSADNVLDSLLWQSLKESGMRECECECGQQFLTRGESNVCPPCRGIAADFQLAPDCELA